jgi:hypothetical protein
MTSLLRRLTIAKTRDSDSSGASTAPIRTLTSSTSFSDFSMGVHSDGRTTGDGVGWPGLKQRQVCLLTPAPRAIVRSERPAPHADGCGPRYGQPRVQPFSAGYERARG